MDLGDHRDGFRRCWTLYPTHKHRQTRPSRALMPVVLEGGRPPWTTHLPKLQVVAKTPVLVVEQPQQTRPTHVPMLLQQHHARPRNHSASSFSGI
jgi:hypothetical protein